MSDSNIAHKYASVAQSVEQGTENPRVGGSIPPRGTKAKDRDRAGVAQLAEQLICNQQVAGSIPVTSSNKGRFPSGQREQTVNLPTMSSVVRIHLFPPQKNGRQSDVRFSVVGRGGSTNHGPKRAWFGCLPKAAAFAKLLSTYSRRRKAGSEPPPPYKRHPKMGAFFSGGNGWIYEPRRFSAWFGCPPKAAAFAKLLPTGFRRRKAGSEPPLDLDNTLL